MKHTYLAALALSLSVGAAHAATTSSTATIALTQTNWTDSVSLDKFDAALGTLDSVVFSITGVVFGNAYFDNGESNPTTIDANVSATITATGPTSAASLAVAPISAVTDIALGADDADGLPDFAGSDSATLTGLTASDSTSTTLTSDLSAFIGAGTFDVGFEAIASSMADGSGNLASFFETSAAATVTVQYNYSAAATDTPPPAPVPLPAGFPLLLAGIGAFAALRLRKNR